VLIQKLMSPFLGPLSRNGVRTSGQANGPLAGICLALALYYAFPAVADSLEGKVTQVVEGDTVVVTDLKNKAHRFRLLGAASPRKGQAFYRDAKKALNERYQGKPVTVEWLRVQVCAPGGKDCAQLARIVWKAEDLALRQINLGLAWHDKSQRREQSTSDRAMYQDAELLARQRKRGLWKNDDPTPPWDFGKVEPKPKKKKKKLPSKR
jgi:endonuclease YncB( thermonuclease family)